MCFSVIISDMAKRISRNVKELLNKSIDSATQAISTYNDPRSTFRTGNFTVLMIIAWTSLLHAYFEREKVNYFYREENGRYKRIDGDKKAWELLECIKQVFDQTDPVRRNIELFIRLRNKIEHRNMPALDKELVGESQALVLNFEDWLIKEFGEKYALIDTLFVPIQLTRSIKRSLPVSRDEKSAIKFVKDYRGLLEAEVENSQQYSFKAYLIPKIGNHRSSSDLAIEFVKYDPANPKEMEKYDKAVVAIKEKQVPVANMTLLKPSMVLEELKKHGYDKAMNWHTNMWRKYKVRPANKAKNKSNCKTEYCIFDKPHNDYLYTNAWVKYLVDNELAKSVAPHKKPLQTK